MIKIKLNFIKIKLNFLLLLEKKKDHLLNGSYA